MTPVTIDVLVPGLLRTSNNSRSACNSRGLTRERGSLATADKPGTSGTINNSKDFSNSRGASNRRDQYIFT